VYLSLLRYGAEGEKGDVAERPKQGISGGKLREIVNLTKSSRIIRRDANDSKKIL
jgi:hypothetical protein